MSSNDLSVIQTAALTKVFRDFWHRQRVVAVDKLDLDVQKDEVFGLLGPNGSGKTTTIKMLLGLLYPTRGRIQVLGRSPTDVEVKSRIGFLPEESYLYQFLDARETLDYYGRLFRIPRQERRRRVEQLLEMTGLGREARRRVGEYSKGMARRIGLAQALINDPDLLILDEPTSGLDPVGTREIKDLIVFLNREKRKTILLCSHLLADVEDVCQRVAVLYGGRLQAVGPIRELLSHENLTQITTEKLSPQTVDRIRRMVESDEGRQIISVSTPSDRLETFFLRIVRQAQQLRHATSGATVGGRIAEFLAESPSSEAVVESLVAAAVKPERVEVAPMPPAAPAEPATDVLRELISSSSIASEAVSPAENEPSAPAPQVDESIIDSLMDRADRKTGPSKE
ncbi:MAG: ABC transporter ATP-binding protein [Planctomycetes bacterium]|nr:ABC transporter ATP-binding protein [Planctomycetota bacterium]